MERDERLLPLPNINDLQTTNREQDYPSSYPPPYDDAFGEKRSIQEYLHVVYKRLPLILALTILATAATAFYMYRKPSVYSASTSIIIEPRKPKASETININFGNDRKYYNTQLKLLRNRELMYDVVIHKGLYKNPNLLKKQNKGFLTTLRSMFSGEEPAETGNEGLQVTTSSEDTLEVSDKELTPEQKRIATMYSSYIMGGVNVVQDPRTNIVAISVTNTVPGLTATVANGVAEVFMKQDIERETRKAREILTDLTKSMADVRETLTKQEGELMAFMRNKDLTTLGPNGLELVTGRLSTLSGQWLTAMGERRKIEANYNTALKAKDVSVLPPDLINNTAVLEAKSRNLEQKSKLRELLRDMDKQITDAEANRRELLVRYTEEYVEVKKINAKIADLKRSRKAAEETGFARINTETRKTEKGAKVDVLSGLKAQLNAVQNRENKLRSEYFNEVSKANVQGQSARELMSLNREIEAKRKLLDTLIQRQQQQELTSRQLAQIETETLFWRFLCPWLAE
jgi:uncharacterized protein involved in exopolysaccharide biosynthesis